MKSLFFLLLSLVVFASGIKWNYCSSDHVISINELKVSPEIVLGGNLTVEFSASISRNVTSGKLALTLEKKEVVYIEIPCIDNIGSCTYDNFCSLIGDHPCDPFFVKYNLPCKCPFPQGKYGIPSVTIPLPVPSNIPSWLESGDYYAKADLTDSEGTIICLEIYATIKVSGQQILVY